MNFKILIILFLVFCGNVDAAELKIPFSCWPKELHEEFAKTGRKLDIHSEDRTKESWGYIVNKGSSFVLFSYNALTPEDFQLIQDVVFKIELEKRNE